ncbi:hypothetical protein AIIKEEIJ_04771 [Rhodococcus sp. YH1]|nr:hypothetical protein [Rhodococcus sp. YH1]
MTVQVAAPARRPARSTAAQRAYQRRSRRTAHLTPDTATPAPARRGGSVAARIPFVATIIGLLGIGMAVTLLLTTRAAEDSYQLSAARDYNQRLIQERAVLQRDVETGNSAPVLAMQAAKLGMIPTGEVARLVVGDDGGVRVVGTPAPAEGAPAAPLNPPAADDRTRAQLPPLAGSAGSENPRPLTPSAGTDRAAAPSAGAAGEAPTTTTPGAAPSAAAAVPPGAAAAVPPGGTAAVPAGATAAVPAGEPAPASPDATPSPGNAGAAPGQPEQLVPVTPATHAEDGRR